MPCAQYECRLFVYTVVLTELFTASCSVLQHLAKKHMEMFQELRDMMRKCLPDVVPVVIVAVVPAVLLGVVSARARIEEG